MKDSDIWQRNEVQSPCVRICVIHPEARSCTGCLRTMDEIAQWSKMTPEQRSEIMEELPGRTGQVVKPRARRAA